MKCTPINTEGPRFYVSVIEGYAIQPRSAGRGVRGTVATVIDGFYGSEHGRFASNDHWPRRAPLRVGEPEYGPRCSCGEPKWLRAPLCRHCYRRGSVYLGRESALAAAAERCAKLNAWHKREGWDKDAA